MSCKKVDKIVLVSNDSYLEHSFKSEKGNFEYLGLSLEVLLDQKGLGELDSVIILTDLKSFTRVLEAQQMSSSLKQ